jgi:hypothetical protein
MFKWILALAIAGGVTSSASADIIETFSFIGPDTHQANPDVTTGDISGTMIFSNYGSDVQPIAVYVNEVNGLFAFAPPSNLNFAIDASSDDAFDISSSGAVISADFYSYDPVTPDGDTNFWLVMNKNITFLEGATSFDNEYNIATTNGFAGVQFAVPEPASIAVFAFGLLGLAVVQRRLMPRRSDHIA